MFRKDRSLDPFFFFVFFNDLSDFVQHSSIIQYSDDTVIYFGSKSTHYIKAALLLGELQKEKINPQNFIP